MIQLNHLEEKKFNTIFFLLFCVVLVKKNYFSYLIKF